MLFNLFGKNPVSEEMLVGEVIHYLKKVKAAVIKAEKETLSVGDKIAVKGHSGEFRQKIQSMQVDHMPVESVSTRILH